MTDHLHARLAVLRRSGEKIYFRIGDADDFYGTLNEFKARVPAHARRYFSSRREWSVHSRYENVLAELFDNYESNADISSAKRTRMTTCASRRRRNRSRSTPASKIFRSALLIGIVIIAILWFTGQFGFSPATPPTTQIIQTTTPHATALPTRTPLPTATPTISLKALAPASVARVVDGDTIDVIIDGRRYRLRYIGMDTPERDEVGFSAATQRNRQLVGSGAVYLEKDISETGPYGRLLRYVYLPDGRMVNEILVEEGWAKAATYPPDVKYADRFRAAERSAREAGRGLWGP